MNHLEETERHEILEVGVEDGVKDGCGVGDGVKGEGGVGSLDRAGALGQHLNQLILLKIHEKVKRLVNQLKVKKKKKHLVRVGN